MSSLLPIRSEPQTGGQDPRIVDLEGEDAEKVFSALSSSTAREIVAFLHEQPSAQSDIADELDTTVQNVRYHLDKLEDAGLVEVVDTWYSSRGNEMKVYAPADGALIVSGDEGTASRLRSAISRLVGGVAVLAMASVLLQTLLERFGNLEGSQVIDQSDAGGGAPPGADGAPPATGTETDPDDGFDVGMGGAGGDGGGADGGDGGMTVTTQAERGDVETTAETVAETVGGQTTTAGEGTTTYTSTTDVATETPTVVATRTATPSETPAPTRTLTETRTATETQTQTATQTETLAQTTTEVVENGGNDGLEVANETVTNATTTVTTTVDPGSADPTAAADVAGGLPPGLAFFLGGASVLLVLTAVWYLAGR